MKVYIATALSNRDEAKQIAKELGKLQIKCTSSWIYRNEEEDVEDAFNLNYSDLRDSDVILVVRRDGTDPGETFLEYAYAIRNRIYTVWIGKPILTALNQKSIYPDTIAFADDTLHAYEILDEKCPDI
jgi:hypothetical protein